MESFLVEKFAEREDAPLALRSTPLLCRYVPLATDSERQTVFHLPFLYIYKYISPSCEQGLDIDLDPEDETKDFSPLP